MLTDLEARWKMAAGFLLSPELPVTERSPFLFFWLLFVNTNEVQTDS